MRCATCGWPVADAEVLSSHPTSEGVVYYLRCVCGRIAIRVPGSGAVASPGGALIGGVGATGRG